MRLAPSAAARPAALAALAVIAALSACHPAAPPAATTGALAGRVRDRATGVAIPTAAVAIQRDGALRPALAETGPDGDYLVPRLPPGRYDVTASYAGATVDVRGVVITAGHTVDVDLELELGKPVAEHLDFGDTHAGDVRTYRPPHADPATGSIEGTVTDTATHERVPGAVVTASSPAAPSAVQVVTDDRGRFEMPALAPGAYTVSAYYTVASHATIEVERTSVPVRGGEASVVPLFVELQQ